MDKAWDEDILQSLQKRVQQSGELLKSLSQPQPINECTAFANYVHDSLLAMNKRKFKKVRWAINKVLTQAMDEDSENEDKSRSFSNVRSNIPPPGRPVTTTAYVSPSRSEMYMWRHNSPQASVWTSATKEYLGKYIQQPLQPHQQPPLQQELNMMAPHPPEFQEPVVLGPVSRVLKQSHDLC
ncbi:hypothetical protein SNE40_002742 [Patella caerulea]